MAKETPSLLPDGPLLRDFGINDSNTFSVEN